MTATVTVTDNNVHADDIILKLDALATAYDEVLSMAKKQLEDFSISEDDWSRIYERIGRRIDYYDLGTVIKNSLFRGFDGMRTDPEGESHVANDDDYRFAKALMGRIKYELETAVRSHLVSDAIKLEMDTVRSEVRSELHALATRAAEDRFAQLCREQIYTADRQRHLVRELLGSCFGDELKAMIREATNQDQS